MEALFVAAFALTLAHDKAKAERAALARTPKVVEFREIGSSHSGTLHRIVVHGTARVGIRQRGVPSPSKRIPPNPGSSR